MVVPVYRTELERLDWLEPRAGTKWSVSKTLQSHQLVFLCYHLSPPVGSDPAPDPMKRRLDPDQAK